jgi:hypothetical protein
LQLFLKSYRQHWTARVAHVVVEFGQRYWVGGVFIALVGLIYILQQFDQSPPSRGDWSARDLRTKFTPESRRFC